MPAVAFPSALASRVQLRFDPTQTGYTDLAQTVPATAQDSRIYSLPQPSPLSGSWTALSALANPSRYASDTVAFEPIAPGYPTPLCQALTAPAPASPIAQNNCTVAIAYRPYSMFSSPVYQPVIYGAGCGFEQLRNQIAISYNAGGANWTPNFFFGPSLGSTYSGIDGTGDLLVVVVQYSATGITVYADENGTVFTDSLVASVAAATVGTIQLAGDGGAGGYFLGGQAVILSGNLSSPDLASLVTWLKASSAAPLYPTTRKILATLGDSIVAGVGPSNHALGWPLLTLAAVRPTYPDLQLLNVGIGGSGADAISGPNSSQYQTAIQYVSSGRSVVVMSAGTNELASDASNSGVDAKLAVQFATADAFRAAGAKVILATVLDRIGTYVGHTAFTTGRTRWNAAVLGSVGTHCDYVVDQASLASMSDATNTTNYPDGTHPSTIGHGLVEPLFLAAVNAALASLTPAPTPSAPTSLALSVVTTSVNVSWADNATTETGYYVYYSTSGVKAGTPQITLPANSTSTTVSGLTSGLTYTFWVEAYNASGSSASITGSIMLAVVTPTATSRYQMQAKSSLDGNLYSWTSGTVDRAGVGFVAAGYPGTPLDVVVYTRSPR